MEAGLVSIGDRTLLQKLLIFLYSKEEMDNFVQGICI